MAFSNAVMNELMVPHAREVAGRVFGFFTAIGWHVRADQNEPRSVYVHPLEGAPVISYWHTINEEKTKFFEHNDEPTPSPYAQGLRLPVLSQLVEVCLIVPDSDTVDALFERGGAILEAHAHVPPREHANAWEFRFSDPFNYALRVTSDPGYEVNTA